jgi:urea transport system permease protein
VQRRSPTNPSEFSPANSIEVAIWVAVGGRGTLVGAILGAGLVNYAESYFTVVAPELWLFVLGGLFVGVTLFFPKGIVGRLAGLRIPRFARRRNDEPQSASRTENA